MDIFQKKMLKCNKGMSHQNLSLTFFFQMKVNKSHMALTRLQFALHMPTAIFIIEFCACLHITVSESSIHTLVFKKKQVLL